jgi:N-carbamoyl-L-amino-acid hydrolase
MALRQGEDATMPDVSALRVNGERLWRNIMAIGQIGETAKGGSNRQALTDEDREGRELFLTWARAAGCTVRVDEIGNLFVRRPGRRDLPPVLTGSHLDTQPTGGKFDGILGVLGGLEVIESLNDANVTTEHPVEVVVWTNEEGARFDTAMLGSAVWSGAMTPADAFTLKDRAGRSVGEELERLGYKGDEPAAPFPVAAAFELHIEQGPVLEDAGVTIGIVTGVQHMSRHRVIIEGQECHAGPTPMNLRKDPVMALARLLPRIYAAAEDHAPEGRVTIGFMNARPGSPNTVPGELEITVDIRHPQRDQYDAMVRDCSTAVEEACAGLGLPVTQRCIWHAPGVAFAPECIDAVRQAVKATGHDALELVSGAGHDACNLSRVAPTSMIFVPCRDGISHNEAEWATEGHCAAGANVLLHAVLETATRT